MSTHGPHAGCFEDMWRVAIEIAKRTGGDPGRGRRVAAERGGGAVSYTHLTLPTKA